MGPIVFRFCRRQDGPVGWRKQGRSGTSLFWHIPALPLYFTAGVTHFGRNMTRFVPKALCLALACFSAASTARAAAADAPPAFAEIYDLVRAQLRGLTAEELDHAAVDGLLAALAPRVVLLTNGAPKPADGPLVIRARVLEDNVAYVRVASVSPGLAQAVADAHRELSRTSKVVGVVLDLRFAGGDAYAAAADTAGLFLKTETALLDWGDGPVKVKPASPGIALPVVVLVNRQTAGAPEALAAAVREAGVGLILGATTAGLAAHKQEFTLKSGHKLLIATTPVKLAGGAALSPHGVRPDIEVATAAAEERAGFADPYRELAKPAELIAGTSATATNAPAGTNRFGRRLRASEADLVRARRDGLSLEGELVSGREPEPARPVLRDAALARAVDLLKGLAVVRPPRS
jgi:hypothetical protein